MKYGIMVLAGCLLMTPFAQADDLQSEMQAMKAQLQAQQARLDAQDAELAKLRSAQGDTWLNERRSEEVKSLVRQVLADAETRSALMDSAITAGHNGNNFFLASEDGNFLLNVSGMIQSRYAYNQTDAHIFGTENDSLDFDGGPLGISADENIGDKSTGGFEVPRAKLRFGGHVINPNLTYAIQFNFAKRATNDLLMEDVPPGGGPNPDRIFMTTLPDVGNGYNNGRGGLSFLEEAWLAYDFADGWNVRIGQFKAPFLREELVNAAHLASAERSLVNDLFTVDYTQGVQLTYVTDDLGVPVRLAAMIHDGSYQANTGFDQDTTDFAIAGRGEILLAGTWKQFDDMQAWSSDGFGLLIGAAIDWEKGERGRNPRVHLFPDDVDEAVYMGNHDILKWTVDVSMEVPDMAGLSVYAAVIGQHLNPHGHPLLVDGADQYGLILQGSAFILPDKLDVFLRYEYIDMDGMAYVPTSTHGAFDYLLGEPFSNEISLVTFGTNYYFAQNRARATLEATWVLDEMPFNASNQNLRADMEDDQFTVRGQVQLLF